jgi:glycosyltransferase involved in cell wall biosynthesis
MSGSTPTPFARARHLLARGRAVSGLDRVLRFVSRPRRRPLAALPEGTIHVLFYSPANLNQLDGSAVWVPGVVETLLADPRVHVTIPLRAPVRRPVITGVLRSLPRVTVVDVHPRIAARRIGLSTTGALDLIERLDRERPADVILLRSHKLCLAATDRPALRGRTWSTYILEPERDVDDPAYRAEMDRIARFSRAVLVQSEGMRALLESAVPSTVGRTLLLPPAIPGAAGPRSDPARPVRRLIYTGKFHPFYPVDLLIDITAGLRADAVPDLELHIAGDQFTPHADLPGYGPALERRLRSTPGVVWHGGLSRAATARLVAEGGVAVSLWDYRYGSHMNDLVVSTKLLDYAAAGAPVVLTRTPTQADILGADYPLFVDDLAAAGEVIRRAVTDPVTYRQAAERAFAASRAFTYDAVLDGLRADLERAAAQ